MANATFTASIKPELHVQLQLYAPASTMAATTAAMMQRDAAQADHSTPTPTPHVDEHTVAAASAATTAAAAGSKTASSEGVNVSVFDPLVVVEVRKLPGTNPFVFVNFFRALHTQLTEHIVEALNDINDNIREELRDMQDDDGY
jgi:hypothetical protein